MSKILKGQMIKVNFRLPEECYESLLAISEASLIPISSLIRYAIAEKYGIKHKKMRGFKSLHKDSIL